MSSPLLRASLAGVIVVLGAFFAWFCLAPADKASPQQNEEQSRPAIRTVKPAQPAKAPAVAETAVSPTNAVRLHRGSRVVKTNVFTNDDGLVWERLYTEDGKKHRVYHYPPPTFRHPSDNYLAMVLGDGGPGPLPPLPDLSGEKNLEQQFRESLKDEIVIGESDDEQTKSIKERVILARESMKALLDQGYKFAEVLEVERRTFNENGSIRAGIQREYHELLKSASADDAEVYREAMNKKLSEMGIEEIPVKEKRRK